MRWGGGSFSCSVGGWASGGPARSKVNVFFPGITDETQAGLLHSHPIPGHVPETATQKKGREPEDVCLSEEILPCVVSFPFSHKRRGYFELGWVSAVPRKQPKHSAGLCWALR